jgi:hypothetical protein
VIHDHHRGYITWNEFVRNKKQLRGNAGLVGAQAGAAKSGPALLAGLLRCARCGRKLHVSYSGIGGRVPRYACQGGHISHGTPWCLSVGGLRVDQAVSAQVLEAMQPIGIEAVLEAVALASRVDEEKRKALELALERARYEANRAHRQYDAVDPENRLVAAELEARWNEALQTVTQAESRLRETTSRQQEVADTERERLLNLGADLTSLWNHAKASAVLKKRILRTLLEEIVIDVREDDPPKIHLRLHWVGGSHTELLIAKNRSGKHQHCADQKVIDLLRELAKVCRDRTIAAILNRLGYRTGAGNTWKEARIASLRHYHHIPACERDPHRTWRTLDEAARESGVSPTVMRRLIRKKLLPAKQVVKLAPWVIERKDLELPAVQAAIKAAREGKRCPRTTPGQQELPYE